MNDDKKMSKMDWFVNAYNNNELNYMISNTGKTHGTVVMPTGAGKSGVIYEDIIYHIRNRKPDEKLIFNLAAPILKLEAQFLNDFIEVAKEIFAKEIGNGEVMLFVNSSANGKTYDAGELNSDTMRFFEIDKFKESKIAKIAIVASCHKSLPKFAEKIDDLNSYASVITYIDEAHLVVNETVDQKTEDKLTGEAHERFEVLQKLCKSAFLYAVTATPDKTVTAEINKQFGITKAEELDTHIIDIPARDCIEKNIILHPMSQTQEVATGAKVHITPELCIGFMDKMKGLTPEINHKVLVTCPSSAHLMWLGGELALRGYKVFATCCATGATAKEGVVEENIDEIKFTNSIDEYDGDCFVLHIKQLIQGIDIKSLTDCIIYNSRRVNDGVKRTIIQTIGRVLRPLPNERGVAEHFRVKKYGGVLFVIGDEDYETVERQMTALLLKYYGRDGIKSFTKDVNENGNMSGRTKQFATGNSHFGDGLESVYENFCKELMVDLEKYVREVLAPRHRWLMMKNAKNGIKNDPEGDVLRKHLEGMKSSFKKFDGVFEVADIIKDTYLMKAVSDLFNEYGITE